MKENSLRRESDMGAAGLDIIDGTKMKVGAQLWSLSIHYCFWLN